MTRRQQQEHGEKCSHRLHSVTLELLEKAECWGSGEDRVAFIISTEWSELVDSLFVYIGFIILVDEPRNESNARPFCSLISSWL